MNKPLTLSWNHGALHDNGSTRFRVWAPHVKQVQVQFASATHKSPRIIPLQRIEQGYHELVVSEALPGTRYSYLIDNNDPRPDPSSRMQPDGVHAPSEVIDRNYSWSDGHWAGVPLEDYVIYELHVGTFSEEGTFDAVVTQLQYLKDLGITAIELMPIAQFPGSRNWGYDGVYPYAAQTSYGGHLGLKRLVNAAHAAGLAVILDVVYNHLGPEGNYLSQFGPYFTDSYKTPWGWSLNFDGPWSDEVRRFFIGNALYWIEDCHIDALRLDAVHAIVDTSAVPFLRELTAEIHAASERLGRSVYVIAENDRNDPAFARPLSAGGMDMDSQWNDDFHHCLHTLLTGERHGYYEDFGQLEQLARAFENGYVYDGIYSPHRKRRHGTSSSDLEGKRFVVCSQNHDQVGNRMLGERLSSLVGFEKLKFAAAATLFSPNIPLLFMGEEYGETAPFLYFISHGDTDLVEAVRRGRREEFAAFHGQGEAPDPQSVAAFVQSRLNRSLMDAPSHLALLNYYRELIRLRRELPSLKELNRHGTQALVFEKERLLIITRDGPGARCIAVLSFAEHDVRVSIPAPSGNWRVMLYSQDSKWLGAAATLPEYYRSDGAITLQLKSCSVLLLLEELT